MKAEATCTGDSGKKLNIDGECVTACNAADDNYLMKTGNTCKYDTATCTEASGKGIKKDGTCATNRDGCAADAKWYFIDTKDIRKCKILTTAYCKADNAAKELVTEAGTCVATCPNYLEPDADKKCVTKNCNGSSKWTNFDGSCADAKTDCKAYSYGDDVDAGK